MQHKHSLTRSLAYQFRFVVRNKSHTVFSFLCSYWQQMTLRLLVYLQFWTFYDVICYHKRADNGKLYSLFVNKFHKRTMWSEFACPANQHTKSTIKNKIFAPREFLPKMCLPCFSHAVLSFWLWNQQNLWHFLAAYLHCVLCSLATYYRYAKDHRL